MTTTDVVRLDEFCEIRGGGKLGLTGSDFLNVGVPAYGAAGINGKVAQTEYRRPGIVLSAIGARCGKCFLADGDWTTLANTQVILPDLDRADVRFLWYQLNDESSWHRSGTAQPFIKPSDVKSRHVHLPPLEEQRRLADILDHADALRAKRRKALTLLNDLTQSIFSDMFCPSALGAQPLGDLATIQIGPFGSLLHADDYVHGGTPLINPMHILDSEIAADSSYSVTEEKARTLKNYRIHAGDVVMGRRGEMGRCAIAGPEHEGFLCGTGSLLIRPGPAVTATYLAHLIRSANMRTRLDAASLGATLPNLNRGILAALAVCVPTLQEQLLFEQSMRFVESQRALLRGGICAVDGLFASFQQRAFAGLL